MFRPLSALALGAVLCTAASAQSMISARAGLVHYVEGNAFVNDKAVETNGTQFPSLNKEDVLRTEEGRAEILLSPGVFLRLGEASSIRMVSTDLTDARLEVLSGTAVVESDDALKTNHVTLTYKGTSMALLKNGLYRVDTEPARFRVYSGEAMVTKDTDHIIVSKNKEVPLTSALVAMKFDGKDTDELVRWAEKRSSYLAMANVSSANSLVGANSGGLGLGSGNWMFNQWYGMYTYVPFNGFSYSPFGYGFWSPFTVGSAYAYWPYYYGNGYATTTSAAPTHSTTIKTSARILTASSSGRTASSMPSFSPAGLNTTPNLNSSARSAAMSSAGTSGRSGGSRK